MNAFLQRRVEQRLDLKQRQEIKVCYEKAIDEIENDAVPELRYICENIERKNNLLKEASSIWVRDMALIYYSMYKFLMCCQNGLEKLSNKSRKSLIAAIFYYVNPFDVIPDHTPGIGFIDDYYVARCCLQKLTQREKELLQKHISSLR